MQLLINETNKEIQTVCLKIYPEIIKLLGIEESHKILTDPLCEFISNLEEKEDNELIETFLKILPEILENLYSKKSFEEIEAHRLFFVEILEHLFSLNKSFEKSARWRKQFQFFQIFSNFKLFLVKCFLLFSFFYIIKDFRNFPFK